MNKPSRRIWKDVGVSLAIGLMFAMIANLYMRPQTTVVTNLTTNNISVDPTDVPSGYGIKYVEPGNATDIQAKIDSCNDSGCMIIIPPGHYDIVRTISISTPKNNIILAGSGVGHAKYGPSEIDFGATVFDHAADGNVISILGIGNSDAREMVDNVMIRNIYFVSDYQKTGFAIYAQSTTEMGVRIIDNAFSEFRDGAIGMKLTWGLVAEGNAFWFCGNSTSGSSAIYYLPPGPDANNYIEIVDNVFEAENRNSASIDVDQSTSSFISGNIIEGGLTGIVAGGSSRIIGNYLYYVTRVGISSGYEDTIIEGNHVEMAAEQGEEGIHTYGGAIIGNYVSQGNYAGILVGIGNSAKVIGNDVRASGRNDRYSGAIILRDHENSVVSNNVVSRGQTGASGILILSTSSNNVIMGNVASGFGYGIYEEVSAGHGRNIIIGNIARDNAFGNITTNGEDTVVTNNFNGDNYQGDMQTIVYRYSGSIQDNLSDIPIMVAYDNLEILDGGFALKNSGTGGGFISVDIRVHNNSVFATRPSVSVDGAMEVDTFTPGSGITSGVVKNDGTEMLDQGDIVWLDISLVGDFTLYPSDIVVILVVRNR